MPNLKRGGPFGRLSRSGDRKMLSPAERVIERNQRGLRWAYDSMLIEQLATPVAEGCQRSASSGSEFLASRSFTSDKMNPKFGLEQADSGHTAMSTSLMYCLFPRNQHAALRGLDP